MNNDIITELIDELEKDQLINSLLRYHVSQTRQEEQNIVDLTCVPLSINLKYMYDRQAMILTVKGKKSEIRLKILSDKHVTYATYNEVYPNVLLNVIKLLYFAVDEQNASIAPVPFSFYGSGYCAFAVCVLLNAVPIYYPNAEDITTIYPDIERFLDNFVLHGQNDKRVKELKEVMKNNKPRVHYLVTSHAELNSLDYFYFGHDYYNKKSNLGGLADVLGVDSIMIRILDKYYAIK